MAEDATRGARGRSRVGLAVWLAVAVAAFGVFATWTTIGSVTLNGVQGPNDGWLVVLAAAFAPAWARSLARRSWPGILAVLGAGLVIGWVAIADWLDARDVGAQVGYGLLLALAAGVALAGVAVAQGVDRGAAAGLRTSHGRHRKANTEER